MSARADILDERESSLGRPLAGSAALHVGIVAFLLVFNWWSNRGRIQFGDADAMGGAVGITPVSSIPLPHRSGRANPVANDTESKVPAKPEKVETRRIEREDPAAIPLRSKQLKRVPERLASNQRYRLPQADAPNQVYSTRGAAVSSPTFGGAAGIGGAGIGNSVFGDRLGWYSQLLTQTLAAKWGDESARIPANTQASRKVVVVFDILRDGTIRNVRVLDSSGVYAVDQAALRAVGSASPVRRLPEEFERNVANVESWFQLQR